MITIKHEVKNCFGHFEYREETANNETLDDVKTAFRLLKLNADVAVQIDNVVLYWDNIEDTELEVLTVRTYDEYNNCTDKKCNFNSVKKEYYNRYR